MKLEQLNCPYCGSNIQMSLSGRKAIFCPYCGNQFAVDDGEKVSTKNINIHKRYTNDAALEKERVRDRENERRHKEDKWIMIGFALFFFMVFATSGFFVLKGEWDNKKSAAAGMIRVGQSASDMEGKKYQVIMEQLDSAGFTNITTIDLDDAGWFSNRADTVDSVSIGGNSSFGSREYFDPDTKVVISYH